MDAVAANAEHWRKGYVAAENVDAPVFRFYGRILAHDFGLDGRGGERVLDFGCGAGAAVSFFDAKGFDAYGVDISKVDLDVAAERWPQLADRLEIIDPRPMADDRWFGGSFDVVISVQTLYYLPESDLRIRMQTIYDQMPPGGIFYATMLASDSDFYLHSTPVDDGMRKVTVSYPRYSVDDYYVLFTESEDQLRERFSMFEPVHVGWYAEKMRSDEGAGKHFTFVGVKR